MTDTGLPTVDGFEQLTTLTGNLVNAQFLATLGVIPTIDYIGSETIRTDDIFRFGEPIRVFFNTSASFASSSAVLPTTRDLDTILQQLFVDEVDIYIAALNTLGEDNVFSTTTNVTYISSADGSTDAGTIAVLVSSGVLLVLVGAGIYHRSQRNDQKDGVDKEIPDDDTVNEMDDITMIVSNTQKDGPVIRAERLPDRWESFKPRRRTETEDEQQRQEVNQDAMFTVSL